MTPFRFQTAQKNSAYASFFCTAVWKLNNVITMLYYWTMHASLCFNCLIESFRSTTSSSTRTTFPLRMFLRMSCAAVKICWIAAVISMVFTKLLLENALAILPCNYEAASEPLLPKVTRCISVFSSRYIRTCPAMLSHVEYRIVFLLLT